MSPSLDSDLYAHLRALAGRIHAERASANEVIQPTELLHEAWEKLSRSRDTWESRTHFIAVAARAMRQILIDRARVRLADRHGGQLARTTLSGVGDDVGVRLDVLALDEALTELEKLDARCAEVVLLRTFGGLTVPEAAEALGVSTRTVDDLWRFARAWLAVRLAEA
jgi:RNA polymerase sigma factor (TIGR02999 family)